MLRFSNRIILVVLLVSANSVHAQAYGISTRVSNTTLLIDDLPPSPGTMTLQNAFPDLDPFPEMMGMDEAPDATGRLAISSRDGVVRIFPKSAAISDNVSTFLDLSERVATQGARGAEEARRPGGHA